MKRRKCDKLGISYISLIISIISLFISYGGYKINKERFNIDTKENLEISVSTGDVESINLKTRDENGFFSYHLNISICCFNTSNLPIYIDRAYIISETPFEIGRYASTTKLDVQNLDLPILVKPQETKYVDCYIQIPIPESVRQYIIDNFVETDDLDIFKIGEYLFFEKYTDMIGNKVEVINKDSYPYYIYNSKSFSLIFFTTKSSCFSVDFYTGLYLPEDEDIDDKYCGLDFEIQYGKYKYIGYAY